MFHRAGIIYLPDPTITLALSGTRKAAASPTLVIRPALVRTVISGLSSPVVTSSTVMWTKASGFSDWEFAGKAENAKTTITASGAAAIRFSSIPALYARRKDEVQKTFDKTEKRLRRENGGVEG